MKKLKKLFLLFSIVLCSCGGNKSSSTSNNQQNNSNSTSVEQKDYCKIEVAEGFEFEYNPSKYPTLKKTVNNATEVVSLNDAIIVSDGCTWTLTKDIEGTQVIRTKTMSLVDGHNYAYITVWAKNDEECNIYSLDIYRLSMFTYQFFNENELIKSDDIEENQLVTQPNNELIKNGYTFDCWVDENGTEITLPYVIKDNINLYAKWIANQYTIRFDTDGGNEIPSITQDCDTVITKPANPTKLGYSFIGWDKEIPETMPYEDMTIKANWVINQYTITFNTDGGNEIPAITQDYNSAITKPNNPTKKGHTFVSWDKEIPDTMPAKDLEIKAIWSTNKYSIIFNSNGGNEITSLTYDYGTKVVLPTPTKDGFQFVGWVNNGVIIKDNNLVVEDNTYLVAYWLDPNLSYKIDDDYKTITVLSCKNLKAKTVYIPKFVSKIEDNAFNSVYSVAIYCEIESKPAGWSDKWNSYRPVYYGITKDNYVELNGLVYIIQNDEAILTKYCGDGTEVVIPNEIEFNDKKYEINCINDEAFAHCYSITSVTLPNTINSIKKNAFNLCESLDSVYCKGTIKDWCNIEFNTYASNPMSYANHFFVLNSNKQYVELTEIKIPNTVTCIGSYQFYNFKNITSITLPSSITSIKNHAIYDCSALENLYYDGNIENWCNIVFEDIYSNPMYYAKNFYMLNSNNEYETLTNIEIPETITHIGAYQFYNIKTISNITIKGKITYVGDYAFHGLELLKTIEIPNSVTSIGKGIFRECTSIEKLTIPFVGVGSNLSNTGKLKDLFSGAVPSTLKELVILDNCVTLEREALYGCESLTSVTLPKSIKTIGYNAFSSCSSLENVYYTGTIEDWCNISFNSEQSNPMCYASHIYMLNSENEYEEVTDIVVPNTIKEIGNYQFYGFNSVKHIIIQNGATSIGCNAFENCLSLESITLPSSIKKIATIVFYKSNLMENVYYNGTIEDWCEITFDNLFSTPMSYGKHFYLLNDNDQYEELTKIVISDKVTNIGDYQFYGFDNVTEVTVSSSVVTIGKSAFESCKSLKKMTLPFIGSNNGTGGSGELSYIYGTDNGEKCALKEVVILEGCTSIRDGAFKNFRSLTSITIPESVTTIGNNAMTSCISLTDIKIPESVQELGKYAFSGCTSLKEITIPTSVTKIGNGIFDDCTSIEKLAIPFVGLSNSEEDGRNGLSNLFNKTIPTTLKEVKVLEGCTVISTMAFYDCSSIVKVILPSTVTKICRRAFMNCNSLTSVFIPKSVETIATNAFYNCPSLIIYCEIDSQPSGWDSNWNHNNYQVIWNYNQNN